MAEVQYNKDGSIRKKRGRPRKNPLPTIEPEEVKPEDTLLIVPLAVNLEAVEEEFLESVKNLKDEIIAERAEITSGDWDVPINLEIEFFDPLLSYQLTGYKPIDEYRGLDFDPSWFTEAREIKMRTGKYCAYPPGTKKYNDFWTEEHNRCNNGYISHGYRITGDNYFFLNYYRLLNTSVEKAGSGRSITYPAFYSKLYEYFHYIDLCERTKHDVCALKARGVGFSEIAACLGIRLYSTVRGASVVYTAFAEKNVRDVLDKCWGQMEYLNMDTEGGMKHLRQRYNAEMHRRASLLNRAREEFGFMSDIAGVVADNPRKLRGDRVDRLFFEESGSNPKLADTYIQSRALVEILGNKFGTRFVWGTGGDEGHALEGLKDMFYNPTGYLVLPYRHNYTQSGDYVLTGFFIPAFTFVAREGYIDNRGVTNTEMAKKYYNDLNLAIVNPLKQIKDRAEFCFTPEDALALEGDNLFNRAILTALKAAIELHKIGPHINIGKMEWTLKDGVQRKENITGVHFSEDKNGHVKILEHPKYGPDGEIPRNLYVAGIDGIDMGEEDTSSLTRNPSQFCVVIMKRAYGTDVPKIVAIYKDRPLKLREAHLTTLKLLWYYNCKAVLESTRISLLTFFREWHLEDKFLMRRPRAVLNDIQGGMSKQFGAQASEHVIKHLLELIAEMIEFYGEELWFIDAINEALQYSYENKGKFDIIAAWGMCLLGNEELQGIVPKFEKKEDNVLRPIGYWVDSRGIRHKGRIPLLLKQIKATWSNGYTDLTGRRSRTYD